MATPFVFHYPIDSVTPHEINCGCLARNICHHFQGWLVVRSSDGNDEPIRSPRNTYRGQDDDEVDDDEDVESDPDGESDSDNETAADTATNPNPDVLNDPELWDRIQHLQWALRDDRIILDVNITRTLLEMRQDSPKQFADVRNACRELARALKKIYPIASVEKIKDLMQLAALGSDMATAACQSRDLMDYVKNGLQKVDLAKLFRTISRVRKDKF